MKILVTGSNSLSGSKFIDYVKNEFQLITPEAPDFDITDVDNVYKTIINSKPDWIVNFSEFSDIEDAQLQPHDHSSLAWRTNVMGIENLVNAFMSDKIIHISNDSVFPCDLSHPGPYGEYDNTPNEGVGLSWYGHTKNMAEKVIHRHGGSILRISNPLCAQDLSRSDLLRSAIVSTKSASPQPLFYDQQITISLLTEVTATIKQIIAQDARGIFHASSDTVSPYDLVNYTFMQFGQEPKLKKSSIIESFKNSNQLLFHPQYAGLKTNITETELGVHFSSWQTVVEILVAQGLSVE